MPEQSNDARIRGLSRFLALATLVVMPLVLLFSWGAWLFPASPFLADGPAPANGLGGGDLGWFILPLRLGAAGIVTVSALITLYGLVGLRRLFAACAEGGYFTAGAVGGFRQFALASLAGAIWAPFQHTLLGVYLSVANPNVPNAVELAFSSDDVRAIGIALTFFLIAHILAEGRRRDEELELIL